MIRQATACDIEPIAQTYVELLTHEQATQSHSNWQLGIYPTEKVPQEKIPTGTMYVLEDQGQVCASMVLNHDQAPEYANIPWQYPALDTQVLVIHTLCVPPSQAGHGYASQMVAFAKEQAKKRGCSVIRIDTFAGNAPATTLYQKHGFSISGYDHILLQGVIPEEQVFLEWAF